MIAKTLHTLGPAGITLLLAMTAGCARGNTPEAQTPATTEPDSAEVALLGLSSEAPSTQVADEPSKPAASADDGSDIIPPFTNASAKSPPKPSKKAGKKRR